MSKRSLFWGQASGKLGEAVYYRAGGEQRTRTWVPKIKNPKTKAQATQRCLFMNMVAAFRALKPFIQTGFISRKSNQSAFNAFVKDNFGRNNWVAEKSMIEAAEFAGYGFSLANGSLTIDTSLSQTTFTNQNTGGTSRTALAFDFACPPVISDDETYMCTYRGSTIFNMLTGNGNPLALPAEFTLIIAAGIRGNAGAGFYVLAVNCSADSADEMHVVYNPVILPPLTADQIHQILSPVGGGFGLEEELQMRDASQVGVINVLDDSDTFAASVMIKVKAESGYNVNAAKLFGTTAFETYADDMKLGSTNANAVIGSYTGVSNVIE